MAAAPGPADLSVEDRIVPGGEPGIGLHLRRKRLAEPGRVRAGRAVLLMHGATFPSASLFDVPVGGASFMDALARRGHDVHALDVRGYGGSTRPPEMEGPIEAAAPVVRTADAVRDLGAAVRHILRERGLDRIDLVGMSWGGSVTAAFTAEHNELVRRLALVAPQWLAEGPVRIDAGGALGAYRRVDVRAFRQRWLAAAPEEARDGLIPPGWFEAWAEATLATDPAAGETGLIRAPSGAVLDVREFWTAGRPVYDPGAIRAPVLLAHAEWDADVTLDRTQALFLKLTGAPYRRWVEVGGGTHMVVLERQRWQVISAVAAFLEEEPAG